MRSSARSSWAMASSISSGRSRRSAYST
ncbi:hypothetical protein R2601_03183 [Salipiger bermudensis HTCC2601]|uniref:Uncharacterized protein n=1 Tax=Salipiger bermudensis (strain DSM 26914 / JCM 13377 / KCTC 12554 / HTCC2601) TaxID=314265 RepID=Q0FWK9_SALBH|nr:hypothetical protein R2601_03183 [Salipiger bermudensis HTCC2601]